MSFPQKSSLATIVAMLAVYGCYFSIVGARVDGDVEAVAYKPLLVVTVVALAVLMAVSHAVLAMLWPREADVVDERDRQIAWRSDRVGGYVLAVGVCGVLSLALAEAPYFYIANAALLAWVLAELSGHMVKLALYRWG